LEAATASAEQQLNEIKTNLATIQQKIADACAKAGREPSSVRLLPVTKTVPAERLRIAFAAGCEEMGENKVQEAREKSELLSDLAIKWCIIGHLQTNKVKYITRFAHEFQALDSLKVAAELDKRLQAAGRGMDVYVQVNSSGEASKFGLPPEEVEDFVRQLPDYASLRVKGLMTLAIFSTDHERVRACFVRMRELQERLRQSAPAGLSFDELSMGMSGDFELAIEEGATVVRVGQAIFGKRPLPDSHYWPGFG
jgi:pyridoxal phosphate enzyme (YggS family)